jgi:hypothetical protein
VCIETGVVYGSMSEAERFNNLGAGSVSWSVKNRRPIYGMHFEYAKLLYIRGNLTRKIWIKPRTKGRL